MAKPEVSELAVVYARYSSHSQGEQSIEGQLSNARDYAAAHGYTIVHEYVDRAKSGRTDNRAEFQQMLKDTAKRQFSVIILWKVDRFGRNREEIAIREAHRLNIPVVGTLDTNCDPEELDYIIPGNDDAIRAVKLITSKMADAVIEANQGEEVYTEEAAAQGEASDIEEVAAAEEA